LKKLKRVQDKDILKKSKNFYPFFFTFK